MPDHVAIDLPVMNRFEYLRADSSVRRLIDTSSPSGVTTIIPRSYSSSHPNPHASIAIAGMSAFSPRVHKLRFLICAATRKSRPPHAVRPAELLQSPSAPTGIF